MTEGLVQKTGKPECEPTVQMLIRNCNDVARRFGHPPLSQEEEEDIRRQYYDRMKERVTFSKNSVVIEILKGLISSTAEAATGAETCRHAENPDCFLVRDACDECTDILREVLAKLENTK